MTGADPTSAGLRPGDRRRARRAAIAAAFLASAAFAAAPGGASAAPGIAVSPAYGTPVAGELIVRFRPGTTSAERAAVVRDENARVVEGLGAPGLNLIRVSAGDTSEALRGLEAAGDVLWAEPNMTGRYEAAPNDPLFARQWWLDNTGQAVPDSDGPNQREFSGVADADIDAPEAWNRTTGDAKVIVAVVDSGVAYDHPDLAPNIWRNPGENGGGKEANGADDDGNGLVDDAFGWDFDANDRDPRDFIGHGTQVAGVVGARGGDGAGVSGVNHTVSIMPLRTGDLPNTAAIAAAFSYAARNGAKVVNASFTVPPSQAIIDAIAAAPKTLFVAAAGNAGADVESPPASTFPCTHPAPNVICVASTDQKDGLVAASNRGRTSVDLAAPGETVWTTRVSSSQPLFETWAPGNPQDWRTNGGWSLVTLGDGSLVVSDSPGVNYANNSDTAWANNVGINTQGRFGCKVKTTVALDIPLPDFLAVEAAAEGTPFQRQSVLSGSSNGFEEVTTQLTGLDDKPSIFLRYRLVSDGAVTGDGAALKFVIVDCVSSTYRGSEFTPATGTSFASPMVAGVAALAWAAAPTATVAQVRAAILGGVDPLAPLAGVTVTGGRLNAAKAVANIVAAVPPGGAAAAARLRILGVRLAPGRRATLRVRCPAGAKACRGTIALRTPARKATARKPAVKSRVLASTRFTVGAGRTRAITVRMTPANLRRLRAGARRAVVVLSVPRAGAKPVVFRFPIRVGEVRR